MTTAEIRARALKVATDQASRYGRDPAEITDATHFINDLSMDSIDRIDLVMALEDEFDVEISDDDADHMPTFGDVVAFIGRALQVAA